MGLGTITLLGMLCTPGQTPADVTPWNSPSMKIPIDYNRDKRNEIKELLLYVSPDQGQTWHHHAVGYPEKDAFFTFNAPADGVYWFNMVVVFTDGTKDPVDVTTATNPQKLLVDATPPVVRLSTASRTGDEISVEWVVEDKYPNPGKTKVAYRPVGAPDTAWKDVPLSGSDVRAMAIVYLSFLRHCQPRSQ